VRGTIVGDVIGSPFEGSLPDSDFNFCLFSSFSRFTDDTVCSIAVADAILSGKEFSQSLREWGQRYLRAGYGAHFRRWLSGEIGDSYGSWGNGAPMRVSPCGWLGETLAHSVHLAEQACLPTHNHPDAIAAAATVVAAIWSGRRGESVQELDEVAAKYLGLRPPSLDALLRGDDNDVRAKTTVLRAIRAVMSGGGFEGAIRYAVQSGGDTDTTAAIAGSIAEAFFGVPDDLWHEAFVRLPAEMRDVVARFEAKRERACAP
jgi:ADP-ribosylglycohydrolase